MPWLEWCPDPQQPDAQWVKIFHPGSWTPQDERDDPPRLIHTERATQSSALSMSPQMLDAILRSSDAAAFSTEDLTRLQDGISQQLSDRARHASQQHQPVRASRGVAPPESIGVSDPYLPMTQPSSSTAKEKPIFELNDE